MPSTVKPLAVPRVDFGRVQGRMARLWDPFERNPHIGVFGISGAGKSHLIRYGILPLRHFSRTVVIDVKEDRDSVWAGFGEPVSELPAAFYAAGADEGKPQFTWRLIVDRSNSKAQLRRVFDQIRSEGHCVVVVDESRSITEREQMGLHSVVENLILEGRGLGITMIMGAQSTAYAVPSLRDQPACLFIGQISDQEQRLAVSKIAGYGRELVPVIAGIPARQWLYRDVWDGPPMLAITDPPGRGSNNG